MKSSAKGLLALAAALVFGLPSCALFPSVASAAASGGEGFAIGASLMKVDTSTSGPNLGANESTRTLLDAKIGYTMTSGLYVGAIYDSRTDELNGSKDERTGYGATVGYHMNGWFIDGSYFLSSTYKLSGGTELSGGSGFGADLGHNFDVATNVYLGVQLSYKSFTYSKTQTTSATNNVKSELAPMLNIGVMF